MLTKPPKRTIWRPSRLLAAFLALLMVASGLALAVVPSSPAGAAEAPVEGIFGGDLSWGVKSSFRNYVVNVAGGDITVADGASQAPDNGVFTFPATGVGGVEDVAVAAGFQGSVHFEAHFHTYGEGEDEVVVPLLDIKVENIRVLFDDVEGGIIADVTSRTFEGTEPTEPPPLVEYENVPLVAFDPTGIVGEGNTWADIPAILTEEGAPAFADFYDAGTEFDPATVTLETATATIEVSQTTGLDPLEETTVTVTGSNFAPDANIGTRPPAKNIPTGVYVVFGRFDDVWQPSQSAPSSARTSLYQRWALPQSSIDYINDNFGGACMGQCVPLGEDGTFEATLEIWPGDATSGNWGVYTYAAGGAAANAAQEVFEPLSFDPVFPDVTQDNAFFGPISWLTAEGITTGFDDDTFRPEAEITRQAVMAFIWRMQGEPAAPPGHPTFVDVPPGAPFYEAISWGAAEGITTGFDDDTFRPSQNISREAMAAFLWRLADEPEPPADFPTFVDVPETNPFYEAISWLAGEGITNGFDDDTFRPGANITRQAMAAFLFRFDEVMSELS